MELLKNFLAGRSSVSPFGQLGRSRRVVTLDEWRGAAYSGGAYNGLYHRLSSHASDMVLEDMERRSHSKSDPREPTFARIEQALRELFAWQVVQACKTPQKVDLAFREFRDFIRVQPIYHWNPDRVNGHIFVCVLVYLFEQWMEVVDERHIEPVPTVGPRESNQAVDVLLQPTLF